MCRGGVKFIRYFDCFSLAVATLGGIFTSSSTDMGVRGVLDRLRQTKPRFIFVDDVAVYNGKNYRFATQDEGSSRLVCKALQS